MTRVPADFAAAIAKWGPTVNKLARQRYGISGQQLLARLTAGESHFNMNAVSNANAKGGTQFIPPTRDAYVKRYGVDPWKNPDQAEHATAIYLKGAHGDLKAYNPGSPTYESYILSQHVAGLGHGKPAPASSGSTTTTTKTTGLTAGADASRRALLASFVLGGDNRITAGTSAAGAGTSDPLALASALRQFGSQTQTKTTTKTTGGSPGSSAPFAGGGSGKVIVSPSANRAGVPLSKNVLGFVDRLAGIAGQSLTIGTGSNHNRMTTTGNVSDHWSGNAADIPSSGVALTRLGQEALIEAGMNPAKARQQKGGAFTLYKGGHRIQVIFNSMVGGNHFNHLHVGVA